MSSCRLFLSGASVPSSSGLLLFDPLLDRHVVLLPLEVAPSAEALVGSMLEFEPSLRVSPLPEDGFLALPDLGVAVVAVSSDEARGARHSEATLCESNSSVVKGSVLKMISRHPFLGHELVVEVLVCRVEQGKFSFKLPLDFDAESFVGDGHSQILSGLPLCVHTGAGRSRAHLASAHPLVLGFSLMRGGEGEGVLVGEVAARLHAFNGVSSALFQGRLFDEALSICPQANRPFKYLGVDQGGDQYLLRIPEWPRANDERYVSASGEEMWHFQCPLVMFQGGVPTWLASRPMIDLDSDGVKTGFIKKPQLAEITGQDITVHLTKKEKSSKIFALLALLELCGPPRKGLFKSSRPFIQSDFVRRGIHLNIIEILESAIEERDPTLAQLCLGSLLRLSEDNLFVCECLFEHVNYVDFLQTLLSAIELDGWKGGETGAYQNIVLAAIELLFDMVKFRKAEETGQRESEGAQICHVLLREMPFLSSPQGIQKCCILLGKLFLERPSANAFLSENGRVNERVREELQKLTALWRGRSLLAEGALEEVLLMLERETREASAAYRKFLERMETPPGERFKPNDWADFQFLKPKGRSQGEEKAEPTLNPSTSPTLSPFIERFGHESGIQVIRGLMLQKRRK